VPRFRITSSTDISDDIADAYDDLHTQFDEPPPTRRRDNRPRHAPGLVLEGKSGRTLVDVDQADLPDQEFGPANDTGPSGSIELPYSSYDVATHGPGPVPDWVITSLDARDTKLGVIKSGKEADVALLDRSLPQGPGCLLAVKTFRGPDHRMFHRDAGYQEGRRIKRSRETRAMAARTKFGRELLAGQWAGAEFAALSAIWKLGAKVPYPVQLIGSELMMEFIGEPDGTAAPRLAAYGGSTADFTELYHDLVFSLEILAQSGLTHGDLSPYNVLVADGGCMVIDLPQVVDLVANPQGMQFLHRDCQNIADFFARKGVLAADAELLELHLTGLAVP